MIVMGGIVGSGIFMNPHVVALHVHTPFLILGVWMAGGALAMLGAFIWAELATRLPGAGGQYLYLREAYHPSVAFVYGWVLLLVTQTGGMAAVAMTFATYFREITGVAWSDSAIAAAVLLGLTAINCMGARAGSNVQSALMLLKMGAIAALVVAGLWRGGGVIHPLPLVERISFWSIGAPSLIGAVAAAMIPVAFAYGGWQTATFVAGEMRHPGRPFARAGAGRDGRGSAIPFGEFRLFESAGAGGAGRDESAGLGRDARGAGGTGRLVDRDGDCGVRSWIPEPGNADGAAGVQRHGVRRLVLPEGGSAFEAHRGAGGGDCAAGPGGDGHCVDREVRADSELRGVGGFHLVLAGGGIAIPVSQAGSTAGSRLSGGHDLPCTGTSLHHRRVCADVRGHRGQHHRNLPGE